MSLRTIFSTSLIISIFLFLSIFFLSNYLPIAQAGQSDNVYGWAWSENVGWFSFNCYNYYGSDPALREDHCANSNYGVKVTTQPGQGTNGGDLGILSGYAWSENVGWISFNRSETGPPPAVPDYSLNNYLAQVDFGRISPGQPFWSEALVSGWGRVLSVCQTGICDPNNNEGEWFGWVKLGDAFGSRPNPDSQVKIDYSGVMGPGNQNTNKEFLDWAWGDQVIGWKSFNCKNNNSCVTSNYKVLINLLGAAPNQPPTATNLDRTLSWCNVAPSKGLAGLSWTYNDPDNNSQSQYQLQVATDVGFNNRAIDCIINQSVASGQKGSSALSVVSSPANVCNDGGELGGRTLEISYNNNYFWRLKVKDSQGDWSDWANGLNFTAPSHAYPWAYFTWLPQFPAVDESVQFADQSFCYSGGPGGQTCNSWLWTFPLPPEWEFGIRDPGPPPILYNNTNQNPQGKFTTLGNEDVTLKATDDSGFFCSITRTVTGRLPLPKWREIVPF